MAKTVDEEDVGICCFISHLPGFRGILKQRYSDFIVNEVDCDGNVVHLTCLDAPLEAKDVNKMELSDQSDKSYTSEIELFRSLAGNSDAEQLKAFISQINSDGEGSALPIVLSPDFDKSHRTAIHNFFKEKFKFLVTDTIDGPDASSKCIRVRLNSKGQCNNGRNSKKRKDRRDKPFDSRGSDHWPEDLGKFLRFHLYKENKDTQEALGVIGKMLGVQPRSFGFAGTKDKRSISTQRVTVFKQHASRLAALNEKLIGIKVGDFCYVREGLLLGQLRGNRFAVTLRGVIAESEDTIKASADALGKDGFINYFGLQRFGSGSMPTHLIGATLLRGEWKAAVSLILDPREGERDAIRNAREYFKESDDIEGALRQLPRNMVAEKAVLQSLKKYPGNYLQALKAIPRTLRMMYVHSYQSYLWNHAASLRVKKYGFDRVVVGDLVYCKGDSSEKVTGVADSECEDDSFNDANDCSHLEEIAETDFHEEKNVSVKAVNAEDLATGNYTIEDVILPLPGSRVIYPMNDITEIYHDLAKKDTINLTESMHPIKEFSITNVTGCYRRVFQKPMEFEWELLTYTDGNIPLAETDMDTISKSMPLNINQKEDPVNRNADEHFSFGCMKQSQNFKNDSMITNYNNEVQSEREVSLSQAELVCASAQVTDDDSPRAQTALKLGFTLPTSSYATMAIRELLKTSTSVLFQKMFNHR
ncbi:multisubstrate pseudouridine synthase 7 isoform X2 [Malania oleifera]|uniref:multisubstrate pseudouridine synthase 7 isoform X2 n=1 Tax=Malania oleifera TaxID=397392 RepID=UPI0025ADEABB|nr:multisubstrate pseudouridine synthase 7 isoform X2 [Malania oleifera]